MAALGPNFTTFYRTVLWAAIDTLARRRRRNGRGIISKGGITIRCSFSAWLPIDRIKVLIFLVFTITAILEHLTVFSTQSSLLTKLIFLARVAAGFTFQPNSSHD